MEKGKKPVRVRKVLVRNSVTQAKPCEVVKEKKQVHFDDSSEDEEVKGEGKDFTSPELCSILKLAEEIKKVQLDPKSELWKSQVGSTSKQYNVNFGQDEKLYHDLVSVDKPHPEPAQKCRSTTYKSTYKKDPEPNVKEILKYELQEEYSFTSFYYPKLRRPEPEFDGRSIYRLCKRLTVYDTY